MMLKQFGMVARLAVCLFAVCFLVITISGCRDDPPPPPPIESTKPPVVEEKTPMEKLPGRYGLVEARDGGTGPTLRPPDATGVLTLSDSNANYEASIFVRTNGTIQSDDGTWSATETEITIAGLQGPYTWDGTYLVLTADDGTAIMKWRRDEDWSDD